MVSPDGKGTAKTMPGQVKGDEGKRTMDEVSETSNDDIDASLRSPQRKLYHMGIGGKVSSNTLARANRVRDWQV